MKKIISSGSRRLGLLFLLLVAFATNSSYAQMICNSSQTFNPQTGTLTSFVCAGENLRWVTTTSNGTNGIPILWHIVTDNTGGAVFVDTNNALDLPSALNGPVNSVLIKTGPLAGSIEVRMLFPTFPLALGCNSAGYGVKTVVSGVPIIPPCPNQPLCIQATAGTIVAEGGDPDTSGTFTYVLSPGGATNTTGLFCDLAAGSYTVRATNQYGCVSADSAPIIVAPVAPRPLILTCPLAVDRPACASQDELEAIFQTWLGTFSVAGGFPPVITVRTPDGVIVPLHAPNHCGGSVTVTWDVRDNCGYTDTCTRTFLVRDSLAPEIVCAAGGDLGCNPLVIPAPTAPTITSACPTLPYTSEDVRESNGCYVTLTRTYTVTNVCNQSDTCQQVFTWKEDHNVPTLLCPAGGDLGCNPAVIPGPGVPTYSDDCPGELVLRVESGSVQVDGCYRSQTHYFEVEDDCHNINRCQQVYTWKVDTTPPVVTCPGDRVLACNAPTPTPEVATAVDGCDGPVPVTASVGTVEVDGCNRTLRITYSATDACTNTGSCVQTFHWTVNTTAPIIVLDLAPSLGIDPTPAQIEAALGTAHIDSPCGATLTVVTGPIRELTPCHFAQTRTWSGIDDCLNRAADVSREVTWTTSGCNPPNGCTLGYWKNHTKAWDCYTTCTLYNSIFTGSTMPASLTLQQALNLMGNTGCENLARQSVAALLSICDGTLNYTVANITDLQTLVNAAFANGTCTAAGALLDGYNNLGGANHCNVAKSPNTTVSTCTTAKGSTSKGGDATGNVAPSNTTFKAYPNPFTNSFSIKSSNTVHPVEINIFDNLGRAIETQTVNPSEFDFTSFGSGYPTGIYNIIFNQATEQKSLRVIKQ